MDVNTNAQNPVIGVRAYGCVPAEAAPFALETIRGHQDVGVMPVAKHFPGHGDTNVDSHLGLPRVEKSLDELMRCELVPYLQAIPQGLPAIMVAHILFPALDAANLPASMSPAILQDLLRKKLGFTGLVMSDCFEMGAIQDNYGTPQGFVAGLKAGLDMGCISHTPALALQALDLAYDAVMDGSLPMEQLDAALARVLEAKRRYADVTVCRQPEEDALCRQHAREIMAAAITRLDDNGPLPAVDAQAFFVGCPAYRATFASNAADDGNTFAETLAQRFGAAFRVTPVQPEQADIQAVLALTHPGQTVVAGTYNGHLNRGQLALVDALCEAQRQVIAVALRNPYDLPALSPKAWKLAAFEYTPLSFDAVEQVLRGAPAPGRLHLL